MQCEGIARVWLVGAKCCEQEALSALTLLNMLGHSRGRGLKHLLSLKRGNATGDGEADRLFRMDVRRPSSDVVWRMTWAGRVEEMGHDGSIGLSGPLLREASVEEVGLMA